jgi:TPR repeat protein
MGIVVLIIVIVIVALAFKGAFSDLKKERRDPEAQHNLGVDFLNKKKFALAVEHFRRAANMGNANSQYNLGVIFGAGVGVRQNDAEAIVWFRKAAEQGVANAQHNLGVLYFNGRGVKQDVVQAESWFRKAAEQGHEQAREAIDLLGSEGLATVRIEPTAARPNHVDDDADPEQLFLQAGHLWFGSAGTKNPTQAVQLFEKAADKGSSEAAAFLSTIYHSGGRGVVAVDLVKASTWNRRAAELGDGAAHFLTQLLSPESGASDERLMVRMDLINDAIAGNPQSQYEAGLCYLNGDEVEKDESRGNEWMLRAAEQGHAEAQKLSGYVPF